MSSKGRSHKYRWRLCSSQRRSGGHHAPGRLPRAAQAGGSGLRVLAPPQPAAVWHLRCAWFSGCDLSCCRLFKLDRWAAGCTQSQQPHSCVALTRTSPPSLPHPLTPLPPPPIPPSAPPTLSPRSPLPRTTHLQLQLQGECSTNSTVFVGTSQKIKVIICDFCSIFLCSIPIFL